MRKAKDTGKEGKRGSIFIPLAILFWDIIFLIFSKSSALIPHGALAPNCALGDPAMAFAEIFLISDGARMDSPCSRSYLA